MKVWTDAIAALQSHGQRTGFGVNSTPPTEVPVGLLLLFYQMENANIIDEASKSSCITWQFFRELKKKAKNLLENN